MTLPESEQMKQWKPTGVSFSSGGVHAIGQLGVLAALRKSGTLDTVQNWYGCSGGCTAAICGVLGASPQWIRDGASVFDMRGSGAFQEDLIADFFTTWGTVSGDELIALLGRIADTWQPGFSSWTFADIPPRLGKLHIIATNLTKGCLTVFNTETTPTVRILDAVRASIAVPCLFTPWISSETGDIFCDGAVIEYFPWESIHEKDKQQTLVVVCSDTVLTQCDVNTSDVKLQTFTDYIGRIVYLARRRKSSSVPNKWIAINNKTINPLNFRITQSERNQLFDEGWELATRLKETLLEIHETHPLYEADSPDTFFVQRPNPEKTQDTRQYHILPQQQGLVLGQPSLGGQLSRRWSL